MESLGSGVAATGVCCMCGDHGLPRELFRCSHCRRRLQHRYCSELYPRVAAYRRCNWCLREGGRGGSPAAVKVATAASKRRISAAFEMSNNSEEDKSKHSCDGGGGCSRSAFCAEPSKPVKKPKVGLMPVEETETATMKGRRKLQPTVGKARFRVKVRRYKLLTEVISC
ncbi:hypothetical protein E2562_008631 [Oryza meyeriana var. granulata]|uniref:PHD-type zinc finger plants domain-containing protein n=1 Tax=Oryza meyeriana var. granulata TaxID=110450 RepID=A0A6G1F5F0_9ORYZ|nr:hypothetical protein E2562_008631 [Oryza meyeriana var. granulata]